jgi:hypothetical protein
MVGCTFCVGCHYLELQFELWFVLQIKTSQDQDFLKIREDILCPNFTFVLLPAVRLPISAQIVECFTEYQKIYSKAVTSISYGKS